MNNIVIIGAGQLGSRHLQALAKLNVNTKIVVVDPSEESLKIAKIRFNEVLTSSNRKINAIYTSSIDKIDFAIDLAVIATNSDVRLQVLEKLLFRKQIKNIIIEKVLFPKLEDYDIALKLVRDYQIKAWVNCSRRMWPFYKTLKEILKDKKILSVNIYGTNWGFSSNSIHMIDLISYLCEKELYSIKELVISDDISESKRKGFIDFNGSITGILGEDIDFKITSYRDGNLPLLIEIAALEELHIINETTCDHFYGNHVTNWKITNEKFSIPYQSELTNIAFNQIIETSECSLTPFETSVKLHIPLISHLLNELSIKKNMKVANCPIT